MLWTAFQKIPTGRLANPARSLFSHSVIVEISIQTFCTRIDPMDYAFITTKFLQYYKTLPGLRMFEGSNIALMERIAAISALDRE